MNPYIDQLAVNTIRCLTMDAVQQAQSGHPGMPMGMADAAYVLWAYILKHHPARPQWPDRDRFVLSAGHGSMLLYSLLHLAGYDLTLEDLMRFRQWDSKTPGHPEYGVTPGVETTTGPLGQGFANAVGMALAERMLAARFNRPGFDIIDHYTYVISSDGCLMEGISAEAASLAGHWGLGRLIVLYDHNSITIDGKTELTFTENVGARFEAYGWQVLHVDGHDRPAVFHALQSARAELSHPSLIICKTHIAYGSPNKQDSPTAHGAPLGEDEVRLTKAQLGWPAEAKFLVPEEVRLHFAKLRNKWSTHYHQWEKKWLAYREAFPEDARAFDKALAGELNDQWQMHLPPMKIAGTEATRTTSGRVLNALAPHIPFLIGGSADLASSNETCLKGWPDIQAGHYEGRNIHFGVREHAMGGIVNGLALHRGFRPYAATFLVFSDYMRPAIRLAALMKLPIIYVFTHDSILIGEDGPTHQPVEHLASLRAIPHLLVIRPADANETIAAWEVTLGYTHGPVALILSRQKLPILPHTTERCKEGLRRGAYILAESPAPSLDLVLIATGSEVALALEAREVLAGKNVSARVISMPCPTLFERQPAEYRHSVLPPTDAPRLIIEAGSPLGWERYIGPRGRVIGIENRFGASAPGPQLAQHFGFTVENVVQHALALLTSLH